MPFQLCEHVNNAGLFSTEVQIRFPVCASVYSRILLILHAWGEMVLEYQLFWIIKQYLYSHLFLCYHADRAISIIIGPGTGFPL